MQVSDGVLAEKQAKSVRRSRRLGLAPNGPSDRTLSKLATLPCWPKRMGSYAEPSPLLEVLFAGPTKCRECPATDLSGQKECWSRTKLRLKRVQKDFPFIFEKAQKSTFAGNMV